jgi:hypothetical protein
MSSNFARKNPLAAIAAFQIAFPAGTVRDVRLLLRCADKDFWPPGYAKIAAAAAADERIIILDNLPDGFLSVTSTTASTCICRSTEARAMVLILPRRRVLEP